MNLDNFLADAFPVKYEEAIKVPNSEFAKVVKFDFDYEEYGISQGFQDCIPATLAMTMIYWGNILGFETTGKTIEEWRHFATRLNRGRGSSVRLMYYAFLQKKTESDETFPEQVLDDTGIPVEIVENGKEIMLQENRYRDEAEDKVLMKIERISMSSFIELLPPCQTDIQIPQILIYDKHAIRGVTSSKSLHAALLFELDIPDKRISLLDPIGVTPTARLKPVGYHFKDFFEGWQASGMSCIQIYPKLWEDDIRRIDLEEFTRRQLHRTLPEFFQEEKN